MRVIAGEFRSRRLKAPPGLDTRPTPDRLRESLFNILAPEIPGCVFLDAYAGTGAVGIEALSRGAATAIFIEKSRAVCDVLRENLASLGLEKRAEVVVGSVAKSIPHRLADIVFLSPPYTVPAEYALAFAALAVHAAPLVVVQHPPQLDPGDTLGVRSRARTVRQGSNFLSFYRLP